MLTSLVVALSGGSQPVLPGFLNSLASPLDHYGLWAVFALVLVEDFGIPVPGETVLIAAAVFAGSGRMNVFAVAVVGFIAAILGDNIGYGIGRFGGRALVDRWGRYVFLTPERVDKAEAFFDRQGAKIIVVARFIEGLRQANGIIAGITEMHWLRFLACNALGAALWVGTWVSVGFLAGQHITSIYNGITKYSTYAVIAALIAIAVWVALRFRKRRRVLLSATTAGDTATDADAATATATASEGDSEAEASVGAGAGDEANAGPDPGPDADPDADTDVAAEADRAAEADVNPDMDGRAKPSDEKA